MHSGYTMAVSCNARSACRVYARVSNRKSRSMLNEFTSVFSNRFTLAKIETTPQIGKILETVCKNTTLNHKDKCKNGYVTKTMRTGAGALAER